MDRGHTLVLGLGNPVLRDDGVGLHVVERLRLLGLPAGVDLEQAGTAGLGVLELVAGYRRLVIVDAIDAGGAPGSVYVLNEAELAEMAPVHTCSAHEADLPTALELGRQLVLPLPEEIFVVAVQVQDTRSFGEQCTPAVAAAVDGICERVLGLCD